MAELQNTLESPDAAAWSKLGEKIAIWDQLRAEIQAARLRIRAELDAYRAKNPEPNQQIRRLLRRQHRCHWQRMLARVQHVRARIAHCCAHLIGEHSEFLQVPADLLPVRS